MIRIEHRTLPSGLSAIARRRDGDLTISISDALEPGQQRAAVRVALRSARRHDWQFGVLPVPAIALLATLWSGLSKLGRALRVHAVATVFAGSAAAGAAAVAAVLVVAAPPTHGHASAGPGAPSHQLWRPGDWPTAPLHSHASTGPGGVGPSQPGSPGPGVIAIATPSTSPTTAPGPGPSPSTSSSSPNPAPSSTSTSASPAPTPAPTASPPPSGGGVCVKILGVVVCL